MVSAFYFYLLISNKKFSAIYVASCHQKPTAKNHKLKFLYSLYYPVNTRRRFDVYTTSITLKRRRMDVKTTLCAYWVRFRDDTKTIS